MPILQKGHERFSSEDLVVALPDYDVVRRELDSLGVADVLLVDTDPRLGLGLVKLTHKPATAGPSPTPHSDPDAFNELLKAVRNRCKDQFGQWVPIIGKNRILDGVSTTSGNVQPGGGSPPGQIRPTGAGHPDRVDAVPDLALTGTKGRGVKVAVLDTRLFPHPDLTGRYIAGPAELLRPEPTQPYLSGHATFVTGLILQRAAAAEIRVHSVLTKDHSTATAWDLARKMAEFVDSDVSVLNLSLCCHTHDGEPPLVLQRAVEVLSPNVVIVAAAGNHGAVTSSPTGLTRRSPAWPAALPDVIAVGARDGAELADFSPRLPWVDVTAPGVNVVSTYLRGPVEISEPGPDGVPNKTETKVFDGYAKWSGTSFAAATVSGAIAAHAVRGRAAARAALRRSFDTGEDADIAPYRYPEGAN